MSATQRNCVYKNSSPHLAPGLSFADPGSGQEVTEIWIREMAVEMKYFWNIWKIKYIGCCSVVKSCPTLLDPMDCSSRPRGLQHARLPCPSLSPGVCSDSCPSSLDATSPILCLLPNFHYDLSLFIYSSAHSLLNNTFSIYTIIWNDIIHILKM